VNDSYEKMILKHYQQHFQLASKQARQQGSAQSFSVKQTRGSQASKLLNIYIFLLNKQAAGWREDVCSAACASAAVALGS
jgi:hypothetical protein